MLATDGAKIAIGVASFILVMNLGTIMRSSGKAASRFFTGAPITGIRHTSATFFYSGVPGHGGVQQSRWALLPGYKRLFYRLGGFSFVLAVAYLLVFHTVVTIVALVAMTLPVIAFLAWRSVKRISAWRHDQNVVNPVALGLRTLIPGLSHNHHTWFTVPKSPNDGYGKEISVILPDTWTGDEMTRKRVEKLITDRFGDEWTEVRWMMGERPMRVKFTRVPQPPTEVQYADVAEILDQAEESAPIVGLATNDEPVTIDLDSESPHILVSMGSGGGKSTLLRILLAQLGANGALLYICDIKRVSQNWAQTLPNARIFRKVEDIHDALVAIMTEVERRYDVIEVDEGANVGPRVVVVLEEMNATIRALELYWNEVREKKDPKLSPAVYAINHLLFTGRQAQTHVIAVAQMATAKSVGGGEARENFAIRILGRYTHNAWKMLVPEVYPIPRSSEIIGRVQVVKSGQAIETQVIISSGEEASQHVLERLRVRPQLVSPAALLTQSKRESPDDWSADAEDWELEK